MQKSLENTLWVIIGISAAVASLVITMWLLSSGMYSHGVYGGNGMMGYGYYGIGIVVIAGAALSVILLLVFIYLLVSLLRPVESAASKTPGNTVGEILAERYARGELTDEEFRRMRENLER